MSEIKPPLSQDDRKKIAEKYGSGINVTPCSVPIRKKRLYFKDKSKQENSSLDNNFQEGQIELIHQGVLPHEITQAELSQNDSAPSKNLLNEDPLSDRHLALTNSNISIVSGQSYDYHETNLGYSQDIPRTSLEEKNESPRTKVDEEDTNYPRTILRQAAQSESLGTPEINPESLQPKRPYKALSGVPKLVVDFIYSRCIETGYLHTLGIKSTELAHFANSTQETVRKSIQRLSSLDIIKKKEILPGPHGFTSYYLSKKTHLEITAFNSEETLSGQSPRTNYRTRPRTLTSSKEYLSPEELALKQRTEDMKKRNENLKRLQEEFFLTAFEIWFDSLSGAQIKALVPQLNGFEAQKSCLRQMFRDAHFLTLRDNPNANVTQLILNPPTQESLAISKKKQELKSEIE